MSDFNKEFLSELELFYNNALLLGYTSIEYEDLLIAKSASGHWVLTGVNCGETVTHIEIPDFIEEIGAKALADCDALESVIFPNKLRSIGEGAFSGCERLKEIEFPDTLEVIEDNAFSHAGLIDIYIPDSVKKLGNYSFSCGKAKSVSVPSGIHIEQNSFWMLRIVRYARGESAKIKFNIRPMFNQIEKEIGPYMTVDCNLQDIYINPIFSLHIRELDGKYVINERESKSFETKPKLKWKKKSKCGSKGVKYA